MKQKKTITKIIALILALFTLAGALTGCMSSSSSNTLKKPETVAAADGGALSAEQLREIATLVVNANDDKKFPVFAYLVAASRGYDMTAEGFDDTKVQPDQLGTGDSAAIAVSILNQANDRVKDKEKISNTNYLGMNSADLDQLIHLFRTTVDVEAENGIVDKILSFIGKVLNWITNTLSGGVYIIGICIFAIVVELLMAPFAVKQQKNAIRQAKLRPKEMAIKNKYKGRTDQVTMQKMQQEIQEMYQREHFSPYNGCLPLLVQFPVLIALYNIVVDPLRYVLGQAAGVSNALSTYYTAPRAAGGMGGVLQSTRGTIELLSGGEISRFSDIVNFGYYNNGAEVWDSLQKVTKFPNFNIFKWNFGLTPSFDNIKDNWVLLLVPVLTFVVYFFSMRLTRKFTNQGMAQPGMDPRQAACSNTMMDVTMPLMSTFFAFLFPAVLGVYWMFRSVIGTLKQFIVSKIMPLPVCTEEDIKAAAKELAGKKPKVEKSERVGKVRSLHRIDDEDFDDTRERALARKAAIEEEMKKEQEKKLFASPFIAAERKAENKKTEKKDEESSSEKDDSSKKE